MSLKAGLVGYWDMDKFVTCKKKEHRLYVAIKQPCPCHKGEFGTLTGQIWYDTTSNELKIYTGKDIQAI